MNPQVPGGARTTESPSRGALGPALRRVCRRRGPTRQPRDGCAGVRGRHCAPAPLLWRQGCFLAALVHGCRPVGTALGAALLPPTRDRLTHGAVQLCIETCSKNRHPWDSIE